MQSEIPRASANHSINCLGVPILVAMEAGAELRGIREADDRRSPTRHHPADSETENNTDGGGGGGGSGTTGDVVANSRGYKVLKIDGSPSTRKKKTSLSSNSNGSNNNGTSEARTSESMDLLEPGRGGSVLQVSASSTEESLPGEEGEEVGELRGVRFHPGSDQDFLFMGEGDDAAAGRNNGSSCPSSSDHDSRQRGPGENLGPPSRRVRGSSPVVGQSRRRLVSSELRLPPKSSAGRKSSSSLGGGGGHKSSGSGASQARGDVLTATRHSPEDGGAQSGEPEASISHVDSTSTLNSEEGDSDAFSSEPQLQSCLSSSEREPSSGGGGGSRPGGRSSKDPPKRRISFPAESVLTAVVQDGDIPELMRILSDPRDRVDINQESHVGLTALHHGVLSNNLDAVKILLTHGAQVNAKDVHGFSPLHTASACGFLQIVSLLVLFGADVFALTSQAEMPVDLAKDVSVIRLLMVEMTRQIHEELYVPALVASKVKHLAAVCQRLLLLLLAHLAHLVAAAWRRYKRKTE